MGHSYLQISGTLVSSDQWDTHIFRRHKGRWEVVLVSASNWEVMFAWMTAPASRMVAAGLTFGTDGWPPAPSAAASPPPSTRQI